MSEEILPASPKLLSVVLYVIVSFEVLLVTKDVLPTSGNLYLAFH